MDECEGSHYNARSCGREATAALICLDQSWT